MAWNNPVSLRQRTNWGEAETNLLLDLWSDAYVQMELRTLPRNQPVFDRMAQIMNNNGFQRTGAQCREKIKTLKKEYKYACLASATAAMTGGGNERSNFRYREKMEVALLAAGINRRGRPSTLLATALIKQEMPSDDYRDAAYVDDGMAASVGGGEGEGGGDSVGVSDLDTDASKTSPGIDVSCDVLSEISGGGCGNDDDGSAPETSMTYLLTDSTAECHHQQQQPQQQKSKRKQLDTSRLELVIDAAVDKITSVLYETQARLLEFEEKRMRFEAEMEAKRRQENRDHEIKLLSSVGQMFLQALQLFQKNGVPQTSSSSELQPPPTTQNNFGFPSCKDASENSS